MEQYLIIIEKGDHNFSGYSPDVPGCVATGNTVEETIQRMEKALYLHLEDMYYQSESFPHAQRLESHLGEIDSDAGDLFTFIQVDLNTVGDVAEMQLHKSTKLNKTTVTT